MNLRYIFTACRILLGLVFLLACAHKILFPDDFALAVFRYHLLPHHAVNGVAIILPWIELTTALALFFSRRFRDAAALLVLAMLVAFTVGTIFNLLRGVQIACGCFSAADADVADWSNVFRNVGYIFLATIVLFEDRLKERWGTLL